MAYRAIDVKVVKVDADRQRLVIKRKKARAGKVRCLKTVFIVDPNVLITDKDNHTILLSGVKVSSKVIVDFMKTKDKKLLVKGITVL